MLGTRQKTVTKDHPSIMARRARRCRASPETAYRIAPEYDAPPDPKHTDDEATAISLGDATSLLQQIVDLPFDMLISANRTSQRNALKHDEQHYEIAIIKAKADSRATTKSKFFPAAPKPVSAHMQPKSTQPISVLESLSSSPTLMTTKEVIDLLRITRNTLCEGCRSGRIPHSRLPNGEYRFDPSRLAHWLNERSA